MIYTPLQGDIIVLSFDPQVGHEQKGRRPGLIISNEEFYKRTRMAMVCPITNSKSGFPMHIELDSRTVTTGEVMCEQVKCLDISARNAAYVEFAPQDIIDRATDMICSFVD